jgi:predicted NBD/HSP70 family sugar kinase
MKPRAGTNKATHSQLRQHNQQLVLRAIYNGYANNRAALAQETGLAKPTVSELISDLIDEGLLEEGGRGESTSGGGKRPRLLHFVPSARHVIGVYIDDEYVLGALAILNGRITARHYIDLNGAEGDAVIETVMDVINGLIAQLDAPLLAIGLGVSGVINEDSGIIHYAPHLGWRELDLRRILSDHYAVPVYVANSTALVAMARYVYGPTDEVQSFATVRVGGSVGVGIVINGAIYHGGGEIGHLRIAERSLIEVPPEWEGCLETFLGWRYVKQRAYAIGRKYPESALPSEGEYIRYLHIRQGVANGDPAALAIQDELSSYLALVFAWIIGLLRPNHISLAGPIADMGQPLLDQTIERTHDLILPDLMQSVTYSLTETNDLVAVGAIAQALHRELGLV